MPTLRHLLPVIALLLLLLLHPALHAVTRAPQPVVTRIHLHHLIEYRSVPLPATAAIHSAMRHRFANPEATLAPQEAQPNLFANFLRSFLSFSSHR